MNAGRVTPLGWGTGAVLAGVVALFGVGVYQAVTAPDHGTVTGRDFRPGYFTTDQQCTSSASRRVCVPHSRWVPPTYRLRLDPGGGEGWRGVPEWEYQSCRVGDRYPECAGGHR